MKKFLLTCILLICSQSIFAATKTIKFATEATYPPFESVTATGQIEGFDIDIINALCAKIQAQCTFSNQPWDSLIPSLQLGKFDAVFGAMAITPERERQVTFTDSYYTNTGSFVAPTTENLIISQNGLKGKTIGVQGGTTFEIYLKTIYGNIVNIKTYASIQNAFLDLTSGRIDAVLGDTPIMIEWHKQLGHNKYTLVGKPINDIKFFSTGAGIAVKKGNTQLVEALNKALAEIKADGTYDKIEKKYFENI